MEDFLQFDHGGSVDGINRANEPETGVEMRRSLGSLGILLLIGAVVAWLELGNRLEIVGHPQVVDGDSLVLEGERIRLMGIDAPELAQICNRNAKVWMCGKAARSALRKHISSALVLCRSSGEDQFGRWLAICKMNDQEINAWMVEAGWAVDFGGYAIEEGKARRAKRGLWSGTFENPQEWRRNNQRDSFAPAYIVQG